MVAYLSKSDAGEGFSQIIDYLNESSIKYALTVNPNIYVSCITTTFSTTYSTIITTLRYPFNISGTTNTTIITSAIDACVALTRRVEHLEYDKVAQALEITKLKRRVKKLEKRNGALEDKIICDLDKTTDFSQQSPQNCPKCGNPVKDSSEPSNENSNVVNAPREPFVVNQDPGKNSLQSPSQINHHCCYGCGDPLEGICCHQCTCKLCGNGAHYGYNCPSKVLIIPDPEPFNIQTIKELPSTMQSFDPKSDLVHKFPTVSNPPSTLIFRKNFKVFMIFNNKIFVVKMAGLLIKLTSVNQRIKAIIISKILVYLKFCLSIQNSVTIKTLIFRKNFKVFMIFNNKIFVVKMEGLLMKLTSVNQRIKAIIISKILAMILILLFLTNPNSSNIPSIILSSMLNMNFSIPKEEEKKIKEAQVANARYWKIPACYDDDDDYNFAITPNKLINSLIMGDEHLDTVSTTKSDEFIKSSVENLVSLLSESEGESECDVPDCEEFTTFSNVLFDADYKSDSSNDQSCSDEDFPEKIFSNPLFEEENIPIKIYQHPHNDESDLMESLPTHDSSLIISSKIDSLLDKFADELALLKSIPRELMKFIVILSDSLMEEIDLSFNLVYPMPSGIKDDDYCCKLRSGSSKEDLFASGVKHGIIQDSSEPSNDNSNVVNAPREPFVVNQDLSICCHQCTCKLCGNGAHYGYNCPPKVLIIPDSEPFNNQTIKELPSTMQSFDPKSDLVHKSPTISNPPSMGDEHPDTVSATESDEFIKSSVENLVPLPSESEGDVPDCEELTTFLNVLFDADYKSDSSDDQSCSDEDFPEKIFSNPLFEEENIPMKIDKHPHNDESDLMESLCTHDSSVIISSKIDSLLDEFADELALLKLILPGIDDTDYDFEEDIRLIEKFFDSLMEEIDLSFNLVYPMPLGIKDDDYDSERDILISEDLPSNDTLSIPEKESFHFDIPSFSRPRAKPPDGNTGFLNIKMMGDISDQKVLMHTLVITLVPNQEKSPYLLSHRGLKTFQPSAKCSMMIHRKNIPILDVPFFHFYPP
uniref:CCHC-type domain-containing protein n=1 Tax=Tanacetum cinerariifolium TaxID=118510 RepID=A0A6L2KWR5_TANCI|nr:hypothetical protein [Tanacetum cinerariifolium]